jgi:RNA polymerase sigma-70 factor (ECF subfamily)
MTALRIVGQAADAEDVVQDVFLEVHRLWQSRDVPNWEATLRTLATRRAIDRLRKRKGEKSLPERVVDIRSATAESLACGRERQELVRQSITRLPQQQAEIFLLRYLEDQSPQQIALALGISTHAVASSLHKARVRLEAELQSLLTPTEK